MSPVIKAPKKCDGAFRFLGVMCLVVSFVVVKGGATACDVVCSLGCEACVLFFVSISLLAFSAHTRALPCRLCVRIRL